MKKIRMILLMCTIIFSIGGIAYADDDAAKIVEITSNDSINNENSLYLIKRAVKCGYINNKGEIVIQPQFEEAYDFSEGSAIIFDKTSRRYAYIDNTGKQITEFKFADAMDFSDGMALVSVMEGDQKKWGYINRSGEMVIKLDKPFGGYLHSFSEGLAAVPVSVGEGNKMETKYGFIDKQGNMVIEAKYAFAAKFTEGLAPVRMDTYGKYRYINKQGETVIEDKFNIAYDFSEGIAKVAVMESGLFKYGYINKQGETIIEPKYSKAGNFSEGVAIVSMDAWGDDLSIIDSTGKTIANTKYKIFDDGQHFSEGLLGVSWQESFETPPYMKYHVGYIDKNGQFKIKYTDTSTVGFGDARDFKDGVALFNSYYIDKQGNKIADYIKY
ncbi:WG containing repeat-containing protein [Peptoclostridium litorale DSM 5388]|uniref:KWG leptospira n=1 Tax=Peptoclostridium litorale DSM 5388 TaxID=1121324 RepID=A0A069RHA6_PEPLI|nr:WG repeat-containing protein [Peptoclostridium litorale]KDR96406.1 KWG leptospira [Peptoclostridium litorale DSM 5388]SIN70965.1 WG containing repeat-containing protein [Peptoclostridium litorale DSM 5388]